MFRGGKIPDFKGYQTPIQQYVSDMTMRYDRQQYDKGYADGYSNGYEQGRKEALESIKEYVNKEV